MSLTQTLIRGALSLGAALLFLLPASASPRVHHNDTWARQEFAKAEGMREALNGRPLGERTRHEYQRVIDAYRRVYFGSPASSKADPSVVATAELMVEMGRRFDDNKILRGAIEQYHFLRKEYPGSKYRFDALFTIGEIYKDDLNDPTAARATFEDFLHRYPRNHLADDAQAAIKAIDTDAEEKEHATQKSARKQRGSNATGSTNAKSDDTTDTADAARNTLPRVTGVRHWSTPDYTRVAIDVEQEVKFGSKRISNPDRIFFDLRDTKLASTLVGKTFDVDDGFLKKIRVAEFQPGRTRIVLEVDNLASYDAFLLPDPYRLIIDVHGKNTQGKQGHAIASTKSELADAKSYPASNDSTTASPYPDDESSEPEAASGGDTKLSARKTQPPSPKTKDVIHFSKSGTETDLPSEDASSDSKPSAKTNGVGVIKTTVAVKGSTRKIPKTIVEPDDKVPSTVASLDPEKLLPEAKSKVKSNPSDDVSSDNADFDTSDHKKPAKSTPHSSSASARRKKSNSSAASDASDARLESREARPTAAGDRSLIRALGLKIGKIVIDAGHGGHDTGTIGPNGLMEKDVVLDVAKRLGHLLETRLGAEVIYTRKDDTFIPLETRTAIANRERADLFISIHANSSSDSDARGVETYYLNFTSSPEALEVAARENAVSEKSIHELQDLVKKIALKEKIEESREFAGDVQQSLYGGLSLNNAGVRDRGIKKAPFIVLIGANMPSILAEISFVSNPTDERKLETTEHRQRIAESLYRGVSKYVNGLSGVKVASKIDKPEGQ
jgi:N-acetylmuramoyl-L-alanine amidase